MIYQDQQEEVKFNFENQTNVYVSKIQTLKNSVTNEGKILTDQYSHIKDNTNRSIAVINHNIQENTFKNIS